MPSSPGAEQLCQQDVLSGESGRVVCIGDIHGNLTELEALWHELSKRYDMACTDVVFLGDYCDRGPATCETLDWLVALALERSGGRAKTVFLAGNHDFCMGSFLGCPCAHVPSGFDLESTNPGYPSGNWKHAVPGGMHYQGRRWANEASYQSTRAFESYGVDVKDGRIDDAEVRPELQRAVPAAHKAFLRNLSWVHEQQVSWEGHGGIRRLICVHSGFEVAKPLEAQLEALRARDLAAPILQLDEKGGEGERRLDGRIAALSGRGRPEGMPGDTARMHPELEAEGATLLVSGHHGFTAAAGNRFIVDSSGGYPEVDNEWLLEALVLPERVLIGHDGRERAPSAAARGFKYDECVL